MAREYREYTVTFSMSLPKHYSHVYNNDLDDTRVALHELLHDTFLGEYIGGIFVERPPVLEPCLDCGNSTACGNGRWVNRYYAWRDDSNGWVCADCNETMHAERRADGCDCSDCLADNDAVTQ